MNNNLKNLKEIGKIIGDVKLSKLQNNMMENLSNSFDKLPHDFEHPKFEIKPPEFHEHIKQLNETISKMQQDNLQREINDKEEHKQDRKLTIVSLTFSGIAMLIAFVSLMLALGTVLRWW